MPHRELKGPVDLSAFHRKFAPYALREERLVSKLLAAFLSADGRALIVECMVVEGHLRQGFFLLATTRDGATMVRIHPRTSPEKTQGVKRTVAWLAALLVESTPGASYGTTNLEPELLAPFSNGPES